MQQPPFPPPRAPQLPTPKIPALLVEDYTQQPPITTYYMHHNNSIDFQPVYKRIKFLLTYPPCPHRLSEVSWPCPPCSEAFLETYWTCAAHLLDYLADFIHLDTPLMQSIWFHLLDIWQESASWMPYEAIIDNSSGVSPRSIQMFSKARWFLEEYKGTLDLMNFTLFGTRGREVPREPILHPPTGDKSSPAGEYNTGPWVSGVKGWMQFLCDGGPGVASFSAHLDTDADMEVGAESTRYIPLPGIAIMKAHTTRARNLACQVSTDAEFLRAFDQNSLVFPTTPHTQIQTYYSPTGSTVSYHLTNGAPPIIRYPGYGDPDMLCSNPTFTLLDECVGVCRGIEAYEPVSGEVQEDGEEEAEEEEEEDEDVEGSFDMWTVHQSLGVKGSGARHEIAKGWGEMFEEWVEAHES